MFEKDDPPGKKFLPVRRTMNEMEKKRNVSLNNVPDRAERHKKALATQRAEEAKSLPAQQDADEENNVPISPDIEPERSSDVERPAAAWEADDSRVSAPGVASCTSQQQAAADGAFTTEGPDGWEGDSPPPAGKNVHEIDSQDSDKDDDNTK